MRKRSHLSGIIQGCKMMDEVKEDAENVISMCSLASSDVYLYDPQQNHLLYLVLYI